MIYLRPACALVQQLHGAELQDLVQEGRRLVDVYGHRLVAAGVSHGLVTVLQSGGVCTVTLTFYSQPNLGAMCDVQAVKRELCVGFPGCLAAGQGGPIKG